jgi:hypothetical protein
MSAVLVARFSPIPAREERAQLMVFTGEYRFGNAQPATARQEEWQLRRFSYRLVVAFRGALLSCRDAFPSRQGVQRIYRRFLTLGLR